MGSSWSEKAHLVPWVPDSRDQNWGWVKNPGVTEREGVWRTAGLCPG